MIRGDQIQQPNQQTIQGEQCGTVVAQLSRRFGEKGEVSFLDGLKSKSPQEMGSKLGKLYEVLNPDKPRESVILGNIIEKISSGKIDKDFMTAFDGQINTEKANVLNLTKETIDIRGCTSGPLTTKGCPDKEAVGIALDVFCKSKQSITKDGMVIIEDTTGKKSKVIDDTGLRIDCQNVISDKKDPCCGYVNLQIQMGKHSYAKVLVKPGEYSEAKVREAFESAMKEAQSGNEVILHNKKLF